MRHTTKLPPARVSPETTARVQAVLREVESLAQFIETAVCVETRYREKQHTLVARAEEALRRADQGVDLMNAEDFVAGMQQRAKAARVRIQAAIASRNRPAAG